MGGRDRVAIVVGGIIILRYRHRFKHSGSRVAIKHLFIEPDSPCYNKAVLVGDPDVPAAFVAGRPQVNASDSDGIKLRVAIDLVDESMRNTPKDADVVDVGLPAIEDLIRACSHPRPRDTREPIEDVGSEHVRKSPKVLGKLGADQAGADNAE